MCANARELSETSRSAERRLRPVGCQPPLGVERGGAAGAGGGDRLPVGVVDEVAAGEDAVEVGAGRRCVDLHVAGVVEVDLAAEQLAARVVTDGEEQAGDSTVRRRHR